MRAYTVYIYGSGQPTQSPSNTLFPTHYLASVKCLLMGPDFQCAWLDAHKCLLFGGELRQGGLAITRVQLAVPFRRTERASFCRIVCVFMKTIVPLFAESSAVSCRVVCFFAESSVFFAVVYVFVLAGTECASFHRAAQGQAVLSEPLFILLPTQGQAVATHTGTTRLVRASLSYTLLNLNTVTLILSEHSYLCQVHRDKLSCRSLFPSCCPHESEIAHTASASSNPLHVCDLFQTPPHRPNLIHTPSSFSVLSLLWYFFPSFIF